MARTILDEVLGYRVDYIEHQLAHAVRDPNGRAYNRTTHLEQRRDMMQGWADYLENLKAYRDELPDGYDLSWTSMVGRAVAPGETINALRISWPAESISAVVQAETAAKWGELTMNVCYCSVFQRCWEVEGLALNSPARRVKACTRSEEDVFENLSPVNQVQDELNPELE